MTSQERDRHFMRRALELARGDRDGAAGTGIACVLVLNGEVLAEGCNRVSQDCDATAHAEMVAMRAAFLKMGRPNLRGVTLYSTLQPCGMCTMACIWSKIDRIVYGAERDQVHQMYFEDRHLQTMDFIRDAFRDDLSVAGGVLSNECASLYFQPNDDVPVEKQGNRG
jgi:tRNA(adenine34) deaminase